MTDSMQISGACDCLGRTCLAWQADGELSSTDVQLILERLCQVDAQACQALHDDASR